MSPDIVLTDLTVLVAVGIVAELLSFILIEIELHSYPFSVEPTYEERGRLLHLRQDFHISFAHYRVLKASKKSHTREIEVFLSLPFLINHKFKFISENGWEGNIILENQNINVLPPPNEHRFARPAQLIRLTQLQDLTQPPKNHLEKPIFILKKDFELLNSSMFIKKLKITSTLNNPQQVRKRRLLPEERVTELIAALKNERVDVRAKAAETLGKMGPEARNAVAQLVVALRDNYFDVRQAASIALEKIDPNWPQSEMTTAQIGKLIVDLTSYNFYVRTAAADILGQIGPRASLAARSLVRALVDEEPKDYDARRIFISALGKMGPLAQAAVPILTSALRDKNGDVREAAASALKSIADKQ